jgi:hypothetical protein
LIRKKGFMQFKNELEAQQTENFYLDKLDSAVNAEEFKQMQNLLTPLNIVRALLLMFDRNQKGKIRWKEH